MKNALTQFWQGDLVPPHPSGGSSPELADLENLMRRNLEKLEDTLTPQQGELLKRYTDLIEEYGIVYGEQIFCTGFCMGARITTEALVGAEDFLP
ncbi:MAG: hypothetical protein IJ001_00305 [Oscillospiraceae bacterium]|nr:hypothetical protein [Oscillospiraceae bacterium]